MGYTIARLDLCSANTLIQADLWGPSASMTTVPNQPGARLDSHQQYPLVVIPKFSGCLPTSQEHPETLHL